MTHDPMAHDPMTGDRAPGDPARGPRRPLLASPRHTAILIAILMGLAAYGIYGQTASHEGRHLVEHRGSALPLYLSLLAAEWGLVRYVMVGLRKSGTRLRDLVDARWSDPKRVLCDLVLGFAFWAVWSLAAAFAGRFLGPDSAKSIDTLLPRDLPEAIVWVLLSLSAGFCEEAVFRGYLQGQFQALWGRTWLAVLAQAVIFGISHGYQGVRNVIAITILGLFYGAVARWRRSLAPVMVAHAWTDIVGGLLSRRS